MQIESQGENQQEIVKNNGHSRAKNQLYLFASEENISHVIDMGKN